MKNICIIGCGGFIGSHLVEHFLANSRWRIYGVDISAQKIRPYLNHDRFSYHHIDAKNIHQLQPLIRKSDCVISLAAICNPSYYNTEPLLTLEAGFLNHMELVKLCCKLKKWLIHFSTCEVYGKTTSHLLGNNTLARDPKYYVLNEDTTPLIMGPVHAQRWIYASAKQLLERTIYAYGFEKGLDYTIIRPFNFIGPRMDYISGVDGDGLPRVLACFMGALLFKKPLMLVDGGKNRRNFTYISDAVEAIDLILKTPGKSKGEIFNIANPDNETTIRDLAYLMIDIYRQLKPGAAKTKFAVKNIAGTKFYGKGYEDCDRRVPDMSKAVRLLGFKPKVDLRSAMEKTIDYYIKEYATGLKP